MKKILTVTVLLAISVVLCAQKEVTRFLGIPVDGTKTEMMQKLKAKGFRYNSTSDCLEGEFNGSQVLLHVVTNNNKVWRIVVMDAIASNEIDIKIKFNNLCRQFEKNKKYMPSSLSMRMIDENENISYGITVEKKRYEAAFCQLANYSLNSVDSLSMTSQIQSLYTKEELANPTEELMETVEAIAFNYIFEKCSKRSVWFMIGEQYGSYRILMYYDNEYNHSDGEDL